MGITYEDLRICHVLVREANDLTERLARLRAMAERCTPQINPNGGGGSRSTGDRVGDSVAKLADMEREGQKRIEAYLSHAYHVDLAISEEVEDSTQRTILRQRYLDGLSWEDLSERTHYSIQWCKELHRRGLDELGIPRRTDTKRH